MLLCTKGWERKLGELGIEIKVKALSAHVYSALCLNSHASEQTWGEQFLMICLLNISTQYCTSGYLCNQQQLHCCNGGGGQRTPQSSKEGGKWKPACCKCLPSSPPTPLHMYIAASITIVAGQKCMLPVALHHYQHRLDLYCLIAT